MDRTNLNLAGFDDDELDVIEVAFDELDLGTGTETELITHLSNCMQANMTSDQLVKAARDLGW